MSKEPNPSGYVRVAECLYRNDSSGSYYAWVKKSGKQIRRSLKTSDRKLANRRLRELRQKLTGLDFSKGKSKLTFKDLSKKWLKNTVVGLKESSVRRRKTSVKKLKEYFGNVEVRKITRLMCDQWAQRRSPGIAASTYNNERETLIGILSYAKREGVILENPAEVTKRRKLGKPEIVIPSKEQFQKLLATLRSLDVRYHMAADLIELLAYSGMRKGEANAIRWSDINLRKGSFTVTGGEIGTKNRETRVVPLFPALKNFLSGLGDHLEQPDSIVVPLKDANNALTTACRIADLPHFNHHTMRHYFVSNAIEKGVDFKTIAAWIGHKDGGLLVAKTYGHLRDTHSYEMAKLMV